MEETSPERQLRLAVGARIAQARGARQVTQEQLAERVGVAPQTIRRIERGRTSPPIGRLVDIAAALGLEFLDLFERTDAEVPAPTWDTDEAKVVALWRDTPTDQRHLLLQVMERFASEQ